MRRLAEALLLVVLSPIILALLAVAAPPIALGLAWDRWHRARLRKAFTARWREAGKDLLLVYSDSPNWKDYVEASWLPRWQARAVVLNWSRRATWDADHPLEAAVFRRWAGDREFNPIAIVIPPRGPVTVVRFWQAFRDYKHGKDRALRLAERRLAEALEAAGGDR
jgi:hypothetical protein